MGPKELSSTKKPTVKRRAHPKVRSGCLTCKIRRVKCDEQRPRCKRCTKFGVLCDGYAPPKDIDSTRPDIPRPIYVDIRPSLYTAPRSPMFDNEEEFRYFETFSTNTAYEIFPMVELGRLRRMILQACEFNRHIRHAIFALGALDMTSQTSIHPSHTRHAVRSSFSNSASHHYKNALQNYSHAIEWAKLDGKDFRIALITSLVILSFEGWIGNHEGAIQQIQIGTRLLKEWKDMSIDRSRSGLPTSALSEDEKLLSHVFTRLSIQLRSAPANRPPPTTALPPLNIDDPERFERMPNSFSTLTEAERFYGTIVRFAVTFVSQGLPRIARTSSLTGSYTVESKSESILIPPDIAKAQKTLEASLRRWMAAFAHLQSMREAQTLEEKKASMTLELQMKATYLGTVKSFCQDELWFDNYHDIYSDIVNLSEALLDCSKVSKVPKFCFDSAVVIPLWFVGHKCREPILRRKVISLLIRYPRREGVWDSVFAGLVIDCIRAFEEEYMENGYIPGWARICQTSFDVDMIHRTVEVKCQQRTSATSDEVVTRRKTVDYYVHTGVTLEQVMAVIAR